MEEDTELNESIVPSMALNREPEDVLDSHHRTAGTARSAPSPLTVAQFRESLEGAVKTAHVTDRTPGSMGLIEEDGESASQLTGHERSDVLRLSAASTKKRARGQSHLL